MTPDRDREILTHQGSFLEMSRQIMVGHPNDKNSASKNWKKDAIYYKKKFL
jgi:hypothetical protein